jgi:hypothetical protein
MHVALPGLGGTGYGLKVALVLTLSEQVRDCDELVEPGHSRNVSLGWSHAEAYAS